MSTPLIDPAVFGELQAAAGADFVAELVQTFAEEGPRILDELAAAHAERAADRFRRAAHSLKSNSQTFGATRLAAMAKALEVDGFPADATPLSALEDELRRTLAALDEVARG